MRRKPRYWLFYVMHWFVRDGLWEKAVKRRIAAQHYPPGWTNEARNVNLLKQIKKGDWLVAGHACWFAGYARATSDFYRGGRSLRVYRKGVSHSYGFRERIDVEWHLVPGWEDEKNWLDLHDLKDRLPRRLSKEQQPMELTEINFDAGACVREIKNTGGISDDELFAKIRRRLDAAGVMALTDLQRQPEQEVSERTLWDELVAEKPVPPRRQTFMVTRPVRNPAIRRRAKERAKWKCEFPDCDVQPFIQRDTDHYYVEAHHLIGLGTRGVEHISNVAVVCPWHHAVLTHGAKDQATEIARQLLRVRSAERTKRP